MRKRREKGKGERDEEENRGKDIRGKKGEGQKGGQGEWEIGKKVKRGRGMRLRISAQGTAV